MERRHMLLRNQRSSTADLLSWSEIPLPDYSSAANRSHQPSDGISEVLGGGCQITNEETELLNKNVSYRKNYSGHKLKEMTGSDIFSDNGKDDPNHKSRIHYHQDQQSQIFFSGEENASPKKPATSTEAAKQKELSRTVQTEGDSNSKKKQLSSAMTKAISGGHEDIFASPPRRFLAAKQQEVKGNRNMEETAPRNLRASVKASNGKSCNKLCSEELVVKSSRKIHSEKIQELTSNGIFKCDKVPPGQSCNKLCSEELVVKSSRTIHSEKIQELTSNGIFKCDKVPPGYSEKLHSSAKSREMSGNNIFADGKSEYRDYYGGARRPPGGESSISLV